MLSGIAVLAAVLASGCIDVTAGDLAYVEREEKRFTVNGRPDVSLAIFDGSIEVRTWDRREVLVVIERRAVDKEAAASIEIAAGQTGDRVVVEARVRRDEPFFWYSNRSVRLFVTMPAAADLRATSGDGSIDAEQIAGRVTLFSGDGRIRARDVSGTLQLTTGDGSIRADNIAGDLDVRTGDGSVDLEGRLTHLRARTGDGSVRISAAPGSNSAGGWDVQTGDGSMVVEIPDGFDGELDVRTGDGRVMLRDVEVSNVTGRMPPRNSLRGRLGQGGATVRLQSGDGSITLRRR